MLKKNYWFSKSWWITWTTTNAMQLQVIAVSCCDLIFFGIVPILLNQTYLRFKLTYRNLYLIITVYTLSPVFLFKILTKSSTEICCWFLNSSIVLTFMTSGSFGWNNEPKGKGNAKLGITNRNNKTEIINNLFIFHFFEEKIK